MTTEREAGTEREGAVPGQRVTREQVRHVAALASLELTEAEEGRLEKDLNAILGHIAELNELDTTAVRPMAQVNELLSEARGTRAGAAGDGLRADVPVPSLERRAVMEQAPATDGVFFKVPKVIER